MHRKLAFLGLKSLLLAAAPFALAAVAMVAPADQAKAGTTCDWVNFPNDMTALARLDGARPAHKQGDVENIRNGCSNHVVTGMGTYIMNMCQEIYVTYTYNVPAGGSSFFDATAADKAAHKEFLKANPLGRNQTTEWEGDEVAAIFTCNEKPKSNPVDVEQVTTDTSVNVSIEKPKLPAYSREGGALNRGFNDFSGAK